MGMMTRSGGGIVVIACVREIDFRGRGRMPHAGRGGRALYPMVSLVDSVMVVWFDETYAIDGARCDAQFTARTFGPDDRMHELRRTQYRINRAGLQAQRAADTGFFIDDRNNGRSVFAKARIEWHGAPVKKLAECLDGRLTAGRALIQLGRTGE